MRHPRRLCDSLRPESNATSCAGKEGRMARNGTAPLILIFVVATAGAGGAAHGEACLAGPNAQSPQGKHWYYRIDRATHRKCWYLGDLNRRSARATQTNSARRRAARPPEAEDWDDVPVKPPVPARAAAPEPEDRDDV